MIAARVQPAAQDRGQEPALSAAHGHAVAAVTVVGFPRVLLRRGGRRARRRDAALTLLPWCTWLSMLLAAVWAPRMPLRVVLDR